MVADDGEDVGKVVYEVLVRVETVVKTAVMVEGPVLPLVV